VPKKPKKFSVSVALKAIVNIPVGASSLEEAQAVEIVLSDVGSFAGRDVSDYRIDVIGVSEDTGWDFLDN
jgi:hypothetical protein